MRCLPAAKPLRMLNGRFRCWPRTATDPLPPVAILSQHDRNQIWTSHSSLATRVQLAK